MEIRPATVQDLPEVERLRSAAFSTAETSVWRGVPADTQLKVRLKIWELSRHALPGLLVCVDGEEVVGTAAIATTETVVRLNWRLVPTLFHLGPVRTPRFLTIWLLANYVPSADEAYFHDMVVAPEHRRRGIALALMTAREDQARQWGKRIASGMVVYDNTPSLRLYEASGYRLLPPPPRNALGRFLGGKPTYMRVEKDL
jgi:GNAT superfamily N-acetyltransferase